MIRFSPYYRPWEKMRPLILYVRYDCVAHLNRNGYINTWYYNAGVYSTYKIYGKVFNVDHYEKYRPYIHWPSTAMHHIVNRSLNIHEEALAQGMSNFIQRYVYKGDREN